LFPSQLAKCGHITRRGVDYYWRARLQDLGFNGFSTHSSRRWVINRLRQKNVSIVDIGEALMINVNTVRRYLDDSSQACESAIASLDIAA